MPWGAAAAAAVSAFSSSQQAGAAKDAAGDQVRASQDAIFAQQQALQQQTARLSPYNSVGGAANTKLSTLLGLGGIPGGAPNAALGFNDPSWAKYVAAGGYAPGATNAPANADQTDSTTDQAMRTAIYNQNSLGVDSNDPAYGSLLSPITMDAVKADPVYASGLDFGLNQGTQAINNRALASGGYNSGATLKALARFASDYGTTKAQAGVNDIQSQRAQTYNFLGGQQQVGLNAAAGQNLATGTAAQNVGNLTTGMGNAQAAGTVGAANAYSGLGSSLGNLYSGYQNQQLLSSLVNGGGSNGGYSQGMDYMSGQLSAI